jgi:hypothetical protein
VVAVVGALESDPAREYATAVDDVLARMMPTAYARGAAVGSDRAAIVDLIAWHARNPRPTFEVVVDHPSVAKWRLVANPHKEGTIMLVCHRAAMAAADRTTETTVNMALAGVTAVGERPGRS